MASAYATALAQVAGSNVNAAAQVIATSSTRELLDGHQALSSLCYHPAELGCGAPLL